MQLTCLLRMVPTLPLLATVAWAFHLLQVPLPTLMPVPLPTQRPGAPWPLPAEMCGGATEAPTPRAQVSGT